MKYADFFELHYFLKDGSHSMDAVVRNKCEREVIAIFFEVARQIGAEISLETFAHEEGGLKELWRAIGRSNNQLVLIVAIVTLIFARFPIVDTEMDALEKEAKRLEIEKLRLEIEKLEEGEQSSERTQDVAESMVKKLQGNGKIAVRRSNYYRLLVDYPEVEAVGYMASAQAPKPEQVVVRQDFALFVLSTDRLPTEVDEDALIEVFAPVLVEGGYHWRGYYMGRAISFVMGDAQFKDAIVAREVQFRYGTKIRCVLNIHRKFDELGEVAVTGYTVATVLDQAEAGSDFVETQQGRRYRYTKALRESQGKLFE